MPTLIELCGFETDTSEMDGKSLMSIIENERHSPTIKMVIVGNSVIEENPPGWQEKEIGNFMPTHMIPAGGLYLY